MKNLILIALIILVATPKLMSQEETMHRNSIAWNMSDMIFKRLTLDFDRLSSNGKMSFIVPISVRFGPPGDQFSSNSSSIPLPNTDNMLDETDWYIGIGFLFYPGGSDQKFRFLFGPEIRYGEATHLSYNGYYEYSIDSYMEEDYEIHYSNTAFLFNVGFKYYPVDQLYMGLKIALGAFSNYSNGIEPLVSPGLKLGFSF